MTGKEIIARLPYKSPFAFVDEITNVSDEEITGRYQVKDDEFFFEGHFPGNPVMPGVITLEIMAQIGLVSLGIYLKKDDSDSENLVPVFASSNVDYLSITNPGDLLEVRAKKIYYRFGKLKCEVTCENLTTEKVVCRGELSGMMVPKSI